MLHDDPEAGRRNSIEDEVTEMELDVMKRLIKKYELAIRTGLLR